MTEFEFLKKLNTVVASQSLLQHVLNRDEFATQYTEIFTGIVRKYDITKEPRDALAYAVELLMVVPERQFFKGLDYSNNRCTFTIDDLVTASVGNESGTAIMSNFNVRELPKNFVAVPNAETRTSGLLGTLGSIKVFTDSYRDPEHLVFELDDLYLVRDRDKQSYNSTLVTHKGEMFTRSISMNTAW